MLSESVIQRYNRKETALIIALHPFNDYCFGEILSISQLECVLSVTSIKFTEARCQLCRALVTSQVLW